MGELVRKSRESLSFQIKFSLLGEGVKAGKGKVLIELRICT